MVWMPENGGGRDARSDGTHNRLSSASGRLSGF